MGICYQSLRQREVTEVSEHGSNKISAVRGYGMRGILVGEGPKPRRLLEKPLQEQKYGGDRRKPW